MSAGTGASGAESAGTPGLRGVAAKAEPKESKGDKHANPRESLSRKRRLRQKMTWSRRVPLSELTEDGMRLFMEDLGAQRQNGTSNYILLPAGTAG